MNIGHLRFMGFFYLRGLKWAYPLCSFVLTFSSKWYSIYI